MSNRYISAVLDRSRHAASERLMLVVLADYADDHGSSYPSVESLARKCRMSRRNAVYVLAALERGGELQVNKNAGPKGANRYRIVLERLGQGVQPAAHVKQLAPVQPSVTTRATGFLSPVQPAAHEPSMNPKEPPSLLRKRAGEPERFADFWTAWPSTDRKQDRKKCSALWAKLKPTADLAARILSHIEACKKSRKWQEGYEPAPLTYLRGERWNDGPPDPAQPGKHSSGGRMSADTDHIFGDAT